MKSDSTVDSAFKKLRLCLNVCYVVAHRSDSEPGVVDHPGPQTPPPQDHRLQRPDDSSTVDQSV